MVTPDTDLVKSLNGSAEDLKAYHTKAYIPVMLFVTFVVIIGVTSNMLALLFYLKSQQKTAFQIIISALCLNDILTNLVLIHDCVTLLFFVNYRNAIVCKLFFFLKHWLVSNSLLLIAAITLDRYLHICHPFWKQISRKMATFTVLSLTTYSFATSARYLYTSDIQPFSWHKGLNASIAEGYLCDLSKEEMRAKVSKMLHLVDICLHGLGAVFFIVCYSFIVRKLMRAKKRLNSFKDVNRSQSDVGSRQVSVISTVDSEETTVESDMSSSRKTVPDNQQGTPESTVSVPAQIATITKDVKKDNVRQRRLTLRFKLSGTERRLTVMALAIAVASVICFVPYYICMTIKPNFDGTTLVYSIGIMFARRSYTLNSTVNPFIMIVFNNAFRKYLKNTTCSKGCIKWCVRVRQVLTHIFSK
ncbi:hypothetical protein ACF0H5_002818 [Mactra antiquata]